MHSWEGPTDPQLVKREESLYCCDLTTDSRHHDKEDLLNAFRHADGGSSIMIGEKGKLGLLHEHHIIHTKSWNSKRKDPRALMNKKNI